MRTSTRQTARWRKRFQAGDSEILERDGPRPPKARIITDRGVKRTVEMTLNQRPVNATQCSKYSIAAAAGISEAALRHIGRTLKKFPHQVQFSLYE